MADPVQPARKTPRPYNIAANWGPCQQERFDRIDEALASLTDKEFAEFQKRAEGGDVEAMFLLSKVTKRAADGKPDYDFNIAWNKKALDAGHLMARYLQAREARQLVRIWSVLSPEERRPQIEGNFLEIRDGKVIAPTNEEFFALADKAAREHGWGDLDFQLGRAYANPDSPPYAFKGIHGDPAKALELTRLAAERGNAAAAEELCASYYYSSERYGVSQNFVEAKRWCAMAAQAECSRSAALHLSEMFRLQQGLPRDATQELLWMHAFEARFFNKR